MFSVHQNSQTETSLMSNIKIEEFDTNDIVINGFEEYELVQVIGIEENTPKQIETPKKQTFKAEVKKDPIQNRFTTEVIRERFDTKYAYLVPPKVSQKTSHVWDHFQQNPDKYVNTCMSCGYSCRMKPDRSTSAMLSHLKKCTAILANCYECRSKVFHK